MALALSGCLESSDSAPRLQTDTAGTTPGVEFNEVSLARGILHEGQDFTSLAWVDFNNDGWEDLWSGVHFLNSNRPASQLYINHQASTFVNIWPHTQTGEFRTDAHGAHWADFDNDGDQDMVVVAGGRSGTSDTGDPTLLFVNENSVLRERGEESGIAQAISRGQFGIWHDYNRDGRLDFAQVNAPRTDGQGRNFFLQQRDLGRFEEVLNGIEWPHEYGGHQLLVTGIDWAETLSSVIAPLRVDSAPPQPIADAPAALDLYLTNRVLVASADFNGDTRTDLFSYGRPLIPNEPCSIPSRSDSSVAFVLPRIYVNAIPTALTFRLNGNATLGFRRQSDMYLWLGQSPEPLPFQALILDSADDRFAGQLAVFPMENGMNVSYDAIAETWHIRALGEWPRDWLFWVKPELELANVEHALPRCPTTSSVESRLLLATSDGFRDRSLRWMVPRGLTCPTALPGDFDNDMDVDIYLACGTVNEDLPDFVLWNVDNDHFEIAEVLAAQGDEAPGFYAFSIIPQRHTAMADYNNDGFLDVAQSPGKLYALATPNGFDQRLSGASFRLLENAGNGKNWIELILQGTRSNREGIGARVLLTAAGKVQLREQSGGFNAYAQSTKRVHFGLGENASAGSIVIHWDSGVVQRLSNVAANQIVRVVEP
jgi:hypothetical protein